MKSSGDGSSPDDVLRQLGGRRMGFDVPDVVEGNHQQYAVHLGDELAGGEDLLQLQDRPGLVQGLLWKIQPQLRAVDEVDGDAASLRHFALPFSWIGGPSSRLACCKNLDPGQHSNRLTLLAYLTDL